MTLMEVGERLGCSWMTVQRRLKAAGVQIRSVGARGTRDNDALTATIVELHNQGLSDYEIAGRLHVSRYLVNDRICIVFGPRGKGSNSRKGGKAYAAKMRKIAIERLNEDPRIELIQYGEPSKVRCVKCGSIYSWTKESRRSKEPCPECRKRRQEAERIARERKEYERKQQYIAACEYRASVARICKECGDPFYSEHENAAYCCETCRKHARNRKAVERRIRRGGGAGTYRHRMRIEITRLTYDRTVTLGAVFKKYKGKCCMCGCKTVRSKEYRPDQATLDHIIALGNNGTHTWDNVQLLCSDCNSKKRDLGQMRLPIAI